MNETTLAALGISAGVINTIGLIPYIRDIFLHKTKPERATWWVWLALGCIAFIAQLQAGATWSTVMTAAGVAAVGLIALLSLKYGYGKFHRRDFISLIIAAIGIAISLLLQSPLFALVVVIVVDAIGAWLTLCKAWVAPHTETLVAWVISTGAAALALLSVGEIELSKLIYPAYIIFADGLISAAVLYRRSKVAYDVLDVK